MPFLYSSVICIYVKPATPAPSTAPTLPWNTHPTQRLSITLVGNPTEGEPHHYTIEDRSKVSGLEGDDQETVVFVVLKFIIWGFWNRRRAEPRGRRDPLEELGGQPVGKEERCRAPLPETPPAESATESASV